jgi:hypothetical protein
VWEAFVAEGAAVADDAAAIDVADVVRRLHTAVEAGDPTALDVLTGAETALRHAWGSALVDAVIAALEGYDFDAAKSALPAPSR